MMMKLFCSLLVAQGALVANCFEFGRSNGKREGASIRSLERDAFIDEESRVFLEFERYLDMSMSLSMSFSTGGGTGGSGGGSGGDSGGNGGGGVGNFAPSSSTPSPVDSPTASPTFDGSSAPSTSLAPTETTSSVPSASPTTPAADAGLFECTDQGVTLVTGTPALVTTPISLTILYEAESTLDTTDGFLSDLERALFSIALTAALECDGTNRRELQEVTRVLTWSSSVVGSCNATEGDDNTCFTLETNMDFELNDNVDPDYAAFLSYTALQSAMNNYTGDGIDSVVRLDYLAPTPNMPDGSTSPPAEARSTRGVSPLVIGACAAMVAGGTLALYVWVHNRRTRNKRHVELEEDNSLSPVSFFSAERDPYEDA